MYSILANQNFKRIKVLYFGPEVKLSKDLNIPGMVNLLCKYYLTLNSNRPINTKKARYSIF